MHTTHSTHIFLVCFCIYFLAAASQAKPYTPSSMDNIVATWDKLPAINRSQQNPAETITELVILLKQAQQPGNSYLYEIAESRLRNIDRDAIKPEPFWLLWGYIKQHQHLFDEAEAAFKNDIAHRGKTENTLLQLHRLAIIQQDYAQAKRYCSQLLGISDVITTQICLLETAGYQNDIEPSYQTLSQLANRADVLNREQSLWLGLLLVDMAQRLRDKFAAGKWAEQFFDKTNLSAVIYWADTQIALGQYTKVKETLETIAEDLYFIEDALLLRLALAEKKSTLQTIWQTQLTERMALREQRQDNTHANELAQYYLDIEPSSSKALYWAKRHWQHTQDSQAKQLLTRAQLTLEGGRD